MELFVRQQVYRLIVSAAQRFWGAEIHRLPFRGRWNPGSRAGARGQVVGLDLLSIGAQLGHADALPAVVADVASSRLDRRMSASADVRTQAVVTV
jgi:hypothetical protein